MLGPVRVAVGDTELLADAWPRRSARALLLLLLTHSGHRLPRDRAIDLLWPEASPEQGGASLRKAVHTLRRVLEPSLDRGRDSAYIDVAGEMVSVRRGAIGTLDVEAFEHALRAAQEPGSDRREELRAALTHYRGHLLADEPGAEWCLSQREALRLARRQAVLTLARLDAEAGEPLATIEYLAALARDDPGDECALQVLLQQLVAGGQGDEALRRSELALAQLREEIGVEPSGETRALIEEIRARRNRIVTTAPFLPAPSRYASLPTPPSHLIGRANEVETLRDVLREPSISLVTLTGPGGTGKTRLALEVARRAAPDFAAGVCFVSLAAIRDYRLVLPAIMRALGFDEGVGRPVDQVLQAALRDTELLLLLDNLEQVIDAAPAIAELLAACSRLTILATSREPLRLQAERLYPTQPLTVPNLRALPPPERLLRVEAIALFVERAQAVRPDFALTRENAPAIAELCTRLDGLPLAIELAAARVRGLPTETLLAWMGRRLALLTEGPRDLPVRLQTMRDAIGWSYDLLTREQQARFRRLAVFAGGFTPETARMVVTLTVNDERHGADVDELTLALCSLVDKNLARRVDQGAEPRFDLLETIREFGLEQLTTSGELAQARQAHARAFRTLAERAREASTGPEQVTWFDRLERELDNLRAALDWAAESGDAALALGLSGALWRFWMARSHLEEGHAQIERALAMPGAADHLNERAEALARAGDLARRCGDLDGAQARLDQSLTLCKQIGNRRVAAWVQTELGCLALARRDYACARVSLKRGLMMAREIGDRSGVAHSQLLLARLAHHTGNNLEAARLAGGSLDIYRAVQDRIAMNWALHSLVHYEIDLGDLPRARATLEEGLALARESGYRWGTIALLEAAAALSAAEGRPVCALRLAGAAHALREPIGAPLPADWQGDLERQLRPARERLGESRSMAVWNSGRGMSIDRAVAEARSVGAG
jgi:predicted ATPase